MVKYSTVLLNFYIITKELKFPKKTCLLRDKKASKIDRKYCIHILQTVPENIQGRSEILAKKLYIFDLKKYLTCYCVFYVTEFQVSTTKLTMFSKVVVN